MAKQYILKLLKVSISFISHLEKLDIMIIFKEYLLLFLLAYFDRECLILMHPV